MLVPIVVRANYKVTASNVIVLESILGSNLPVLHPSVSVLCRADSLSLALTKDVTFTNQVDPDFNGTVSNALQSASLTTGSQIDLVGLANQLSPSSHGITHTLTLTKTGIGAEAQVSLVVTGFVESSIQADPSTVINV